MRIWDGGGLPLRRQWVKTGRHTSQLGYAVDPICRRSAGQIRAAARRANRVLPDKVVEQLAGTVISKDALRAVIARHGLPPKKAGRE